MADQPPQNPNPAAQPNPAPQPAPAQPVPPAAQPVPPAAQPVPPAAQPVPPSAQPAAPGAPQLAAEQAETVEKAKKKAIKEQKKRKRLIVTLVGVLIFVFLMVFMVAFFILSQSGEGTSNPLLQLFGVSEEELYPFLINMANLFFGLFDFLVFILAVVGVFMVSMVKKENVAGKKKGIVMLAIGLTLFMLISTAWAGSYFYLEGKKSEYTQNRAGETQHIKTNPEKINNLTAPALVEFDASQLPVDITRFTVISYAWDFGDGTIGTGEKVSHRYTSKGEKDGRYIVTLKVTYRDKRTSEEASQDFTVDVVFVNEKVNAFFKATPAEGGIPLIVQFDASESLDPDGEIVNYEWDLDGDGQFDDGRGETISFTYTKFGTYTVQLRVTDNNGESDSMELNVVANEGSRPTAEINVDFEDGSVLYVGKNYLFNARSPSSPNGSISSYEWNFGDGTNVTKNKNAEHQFTRSGNFTVTLIMTDQKGEKGQVTADIEVVTEASAPRPAITTNENWANEAEDEIRGEVPFTVQFSAKNTTDPDNDVVNYAWDLDGDGTVDKVGEDIEYTYRDAGTYTAVLYVEDAAGHESEVEIKVVAGAQGLRAELTADTLNGEVPLVVRFDASGSSYPNQQIVNYEWDFGNSTTRFGTAQINYTYNEVGTFEAKVTAIASDGARATDSLFINVLPVSLNACFTPNVESGNAPLVVTFNSSCSKGTIANYRWDFGDGDLSFAHKPTHTFTTPGTYTVTLTVQDSNNISDTFTDTIAVQGSS